MIYAMLEFSMKRFINLGPVNMYLEMKDNETDEFVWMNCCVCALCYFFHMGSTGENLSSDVCEQRRRRPACTSAQSDQRLCYSPIEKYHI